MGRVKQLGYTLKDLISSGNAENSSRLVFDCFGESGESYA
jgi:hypothetical protein